MTRVLLALVFTLAGLPAYAQQWDQVNGSMQVKSGPTAPLVIIDQTASGQKSLSLRSNGTEVCFFTATAMSCTGSFTFSSPTITVDTLTFSVANPDASFSRGAANRIDTGANDTIRINATGLAVTSTNGEELINTTAATGGATVQMSPRTVWQGNAWDTAASQTVAFFAENLPATAATPTGTWKLGYSLNGAAATYPYTVSSSGNGTLLGGITVGSGGGMQWNTRSVLSSPADAQMNLTNVANSAGIGFDVSTDSTVKIRTRAQSGYGTIDVLGIQMSGGTSITTVVAGVAAAYKIARGSTAFDGSNPTTVATGLTSVVSCTATLIRTTALSSATAFVTHATASGANVDFYAWLLTGAASTNTETFEWICIGT